MTRKTQNMFKQQTTRRLVLFFYVFAAIVLIAGCGGRKNATEIKLDTPQDTMRSVLAAVENRDEQAFVACFKADEDEQPLVKSVYHNFVASSDFEQAVLSAFGKEGSGILQGDAWHMMPKLGSVDEMTFDSTPDDTIRVSLPPMGELYLARADGKWLVDAGRFAENVEPQQLIDKFDAMTRIMREMTVEAGKEDATFESIAERLGQRMFEETLGDIEI